MNGVDEATMQYVAERVAEAENRRDSAIRAVEILRDALEQSMTAINDWLNVYASEFCDEDRVKQAKERIGEFGTIGYIAMVQCINRKALEEIKDA